MGNNYNKAEKDLKKELGLHGSIRWAKPNDESLFRPYKRLVDIFGNRLGNNLTDDDKKYWIETMIRNSGYSDDFEIKEDKPPITLPSKLGRKYVAACIYPSKIEFPMGIHEGTHLLGNYGPENKRIIKKNRDVPLAKILEVFFDLRKNPSKLNEIFQGASEEEIKALSVNPFFDKFVEHSDHETFEAGITAANAYFMAKEQGEEAGINHIVSLMEEAILEKC